ncbi:hypothetical protein [Clostridium manihotivorum]|uniref:Uncharacterized protein n=1 Tax=Clostridium manihotivorum TaxID=2320868 RepID=A0A3R5QS57_9CLOT|nr:hypothetical protein [Clostridium manihotivorum]QAA31103.1 hypothetical protein C1I91_05175 [Clostridium manihotivorum]
MFKKILLAFFALIILLCVVIFIKNDLNNSKYTFSSVTEEINYNCSLVMNVENKVYNYETVRIFEIDADKDNILSNKNIEVKNNKLNYCGYQITKNQDFVFTYIDNEKSVLKIKSPLSEDLREFLVTSFLKEGVTNIIVFPFKNTNKIFVNAQGNFYFVNLLSKKITPLNHGKYKIPSMNLKQNVVTIIKVDAFTNLTYVFDEDGNTICKYL